MFIKMFDESTEGFTLLVLIAGRSCDIQSRLRLPSDATNVLAAVVNHHSKHRRSLYHRDFFISFFSASPRVFLFLLYFSSFSFCLVRSTVLFIILFTVQHF